MKSDLAWKREWEAKVREKARQEQARQEQRERQPKRKKRSYDMPLSLLEAMSYGNCCLVSDIPECAEVVEDKALIFKKSDVKDLQEKLQDACDHPEMVMKMKNQAADFICEKYNWDEVVKETMKLYRKK